MLSSDSLVVLGLAALGGVVWLVRLEGKIRGVERENGALGKALEATQTSLKAVQEGHHNLSIRVVEQLGNIRETLARIEERIGHGREIT